MSKLLPTIRTTILSIVIVFSILIIVSTLRIGGNGIYVVMSGSMEPQIHTGSVVIDRNHPDYKVGDVITFKADNDAGTVTHRVVEIKTDANDNTFYIVKGDANDSPDPELVSQENVIGKVSFSIPLIGYLIAFLKTLPGLFIFIIVPASLIIYDEVTNIHSEIAKIKSAEKKVVEEIKKVEKVIEKEEKKLVKGIRKK